MSKDAVQKLIGQMVGDDRFRAEFFRDPDAAVAASGLAITPDELAALKRLQPSDLNVQVNPIQPGGVSAMWKISQLNA